MIGKLDTLAHGHPLLRNILGLVLVAALIVILLSSMVSIAQFFAALILRIFGIAFNKKMIIRCVIVQMIALVGAISGAFMVLNMRGVTKSVSLADGTLAVVAFVTLFVCAAWGLVWFLKRWIRFDNNHSILLLLVADGVILAGLGVLCVMQAQSYLIFMAIPLFPLGIAAFAGNYSVFKN